MGLPGVAYDGSMWVTAASSVGLVVGSMGLVAGSAALLARRMAAGEIRMPDVNAGMGGGAQPARRVQPLRKTSSGSEQGISPPPRAESVDEAQ
ncbi:hypothetical protein C2E21_5275 [Chlorella sorokiniana]|uniref:Uncharacterized protein n=1 Tax=Chlorella sorokiniana TaxID=3076 RepID=A0A2P6TQ98_CHLSO|nr:hypothetical protein C2E21_5275 [Chlorella sorokiniana]|eukprot:PRW56209.1 hypothetical protein C2E21_5275 [Chlorella sorokiniana]